MKTARHKKLSGSKVMVTLGMDLCLKTSALTQWNVVSSSNYLIMTKKQTEEEFIDRGLCYTETTIDCARENISWVTGTLIPNPYKVYMMVNCSILIC